MDGERQATPAPRTDAPLMHAPTPKPLQPDVPRERPCAECPLVVDRRTFLRGAALAAAATLAALGAAPSAAFADGVRAIAPLATAGGQHTYQMPTADGAAVDSANDVIIARWQGRVYAFSIKCPHRGTRLQWHADETRIFCPKHKARFRPDGAHDSGRATRDLDRYDVRRQGTDLVVNFDTVRRSDRDAAAWSAAVVTVG